MRTVGAAIEFADLVVDSLRQPVLVVDGSLRATTANRAFYETMSIAPGALTGKAVDELIVDGPRLRTMLEKVADNGGEAGELEIVCTTAAGEQKVFSVTARRLHQEQGPTEWLLVELRDISRTKSVERKMIEANRALERHAADLERTNKELDAFTHTISHDLRTPLRFTSRIAHLLLDEHGPTLPASVVEMVNMILGSTEEMGKLIENLLHFSRISRERMKKKRVDMQRLVRESIEELDEERQGRDVEIVVDELPPCQGDAALLKQLILNLLENALKYTRECESAKIIIGCIQTGDQCVYFIRDNGVGFDPSDSESMFLVFRRLNRTRKFAGSGIGLAIAKRIVERHDGRLWADGEIDRGATFYFTIGEKPDALHRSDERT